jgi:hypothetical protein
MIHDELCHHESLPFDADSFCGYPEVGLRRDILGLFYSFSRCPAKTRAICLDHSHDTWYKVCSLIGVSNKALI